jgi:ACR3 family arsenite efflux pump ArsB
LALAQETRLDLFRLLVTVGPEGLPAGVIADRLGVLPASLSFHLAQLVHAGLITQRRLSRQLIYSAEYAAMNDRALGVPHNVACPSALIGASNFFELAVAAAIALFGFQSGAALATVVGVLVEVPVMLSVVRIVLRTRGWYQAA